MTELGNRLKEARLEKGMSLEELQAVTKIQKRYLIGIEEGNYSMMPGPFYVRAFIKQYAEAVGLIPEELFEEYKTDVPSTLNDDIPEKLSRVQSRKDIPGKSSKVFEIFPKILIIAFIIGALFLVWYYLPKITGDETGEQVKDEGQETKFEQNEDLTIEKDEAEDEDASTNDEGAKEDEDGDDNGEGTEDTEDAEQTNSEQEISVVESKGRQTVYELKNADKFELKVASTGGDTWINISNGQGKSFGQGTLAKGGAEESKTVDFTEETEAKIIVGNSANTEIYVNDQKIEFVTSPSEHVRQDITILYVKDSQ